MEGGGSLLGHLQLVQHMDSMPVGSGSGGGGEVAAAQLSRPVHTHYNISGEFVWICLGIWLPIMDCSRADPGFQEGGWVQICTQY